MAKDKSVIVFLSYHFQHYPEFDSVLIEKAKKLGGEDGDTGAGFGVRDMEFTFDSAENAKKFVAFAKKSNKIKTVGME